MEIKNKQDIINELTEMLVNYDKELNSNYQTDVYCYIDEDGNATLDEFINVGGNSWRNDDHYVVYTDKEHYKNEFECLGISNINDISSIVNIDYDDLIKETREYEEIDEDEDVDYFDVCHYVKNNDYYTNIIHNAYLDHVEDGRADYYRKACELVRELEENIKSDK